MWRVLIAPHSGVIDCNFYFNISILMSLLYASLDASGGYFGLAFATPPPPRVERFSALTL